MNAKRYAASQLNVGDHLVIPGINVTLEILKIVDTGNDRTFTVDSYENKVFPLTVESDTMLLAVKEDDQNES